MENSQEPTFGFVDNRSSSYVDNQVYYGLTKREYFSAIALSQAVAVWYNHTNEELVKRSIELADELLKQLEQ